MACSKSSRFEARRQPTLRSPPGRHLMIPAMDGRQAPEREITFRVDVPETELGGSYANFLSVWHTSHEFTLDFSATQPGQEEVPGDETSPIVVPCRVVSRVRIPASLVFDV